MPRLVQAGGPAEGDEGGRGVARLHALDGQVVVEVRQRPRVRDRAPVVGGPEVVHVEVHDVLAFLPQVHENVDVPVQDEGIVLEGPVGRDVHLLVVHVQAHVAGHGHEHGGERQAVAPPRPERLGGRARRLLVLQPEGALAHDRAGQAPQSGGPVGGAGDVRVQEVLHLGAHGEHRFLVDERR
jgi:hypothetical protein